MAKEDKDIRAENLGTDDERELDEAVKKAEKAAAEADAALDSFLGRESTGAKTGGKSGQRSNRSLIILTAAVIAVIALIVVIIIINNQPYPEGKDDPGYAEARSVATVDEKGVHNIVIPTDASGDPVQNGSGSLLSYVPSQLKSVSVKNRDGSFTVLAHTDSGQATEYALEGYEDFELRTGVPDDVANDASALSFSTVAGSITNIADFGLDHPRATVSVAFTDGTSALIRVGDNAPSSAGVYVAFGDSNNVFLVAEDAVDSFFYQPTDFISLTITKGAESTENAEFTRLAVSGTHFPETIVLKPNTDEAVNYYYRMTSPHALYADPVMSSDVAGSVRDLYAEEVVAVNAEGKNIAAFLAPYGLGIESYAEVTAEYPDGTIRLRASEPDKDGYVYLVNASDEEKGSRVVYKIQLGALSWATVTLEELYPDTILSVKRTALSEITIKADDKVYTIKVDTRTQTVENTEGGTDEITTTEAYYNDRLLDDEHFTILFQNLADLQNSGYSSANTGKVILEITYTYTTGRAPDTIVIYESDSKLAPATLNGAVCGSTSKKDAATIIEIIEDIAAGRPPEDETTEEE